MKNVLISYKPTGIAAKTSNRNRQMTLVLILRYFKSVQHVVFGRFKWSKQMFATYMSKVYSKATPGNV